MAENFAQKIIHHLKKGDFFASLLIHIFFTRKVYKLFNLLVPFIKVQKNRIFCDAFIGSGYNGNSKYIAEKLHSLRPEYEIIFAYDKEKCKKSDFPAFIKTVSLYSFKHLVALGSSKFWIIDYRPLVHIHKRKNQFYIQTWHASVGTKKSEKDSEAELSKQYVKNAIKDSSQIDLITCGSEQMFNFHKNAFWYSGEIMKSGCPRSDILFDKEKSAQLKNKLGFEDKKICIYAPTFRNSHSLESYRLDFEKLKNALKEKFSGEWKIILRLHPNMADVDVKNLPPFVKNFSRYADVMELLCASDVLITDYSSIIYDFMLTGRAGFIYATDFADYEKERGFLIDLKDTPFSIAQNNDELEKNILNFDYEDYSRKVSDFKKKIGSYEDGSASERVVNWILEKNGEEKNGK